LILGICALPYQAYAANGLPGHPKFGYGARLTIQNQDIENAITTASSVDLDWLAVDYDWSKIWPSPNLNPNLKHLDELMASAQTQELAVLVSITNPPTWLLTPSGPDPQLTVTVVSTLAARYPETLLAIELYPGANTQQGWGVEPEPSNYASLLKTVHLTLQRVDPEIVVVAAGLEPVTDGPNDIDDLTFLSALYHQGCAPYMPVIGLRLANISMVPTQPPKKPQDNTLRHYEAVREIMLRNDHRHGLIWVTGFSWDSTALPSPEYQAIWLKQAFLMMRAQLYIGTAFIQDLNPFSQPTSFGVNVPTSHPGIGVIRQIIAMENSQHTRTFEVSLVKSASNQLSKSHYP
jgi:hypothetical protein